MEIGKFYSFKIKGWQYAINGVVCDIGAEWILIKAIIGDFQYDGFSIIRTKHIKEWIHDERNIFIEHVLLTKGIMDIPFPNIPLDNPTTPFLWFLQQKEIIFFTPKDESDGFMGEIIKLTKRQFDLHPMLSEGIWSLETWTFSINNIIVIEWQSDYIKSLIKYSQTVVS